MYKSKSICISLSGDYAIIHNPWCAILLTSGHVWIGHYRGAIADPPVWPARPREIDRASARARRRGAHLDAVGDGSATIINRDLPARARVARRAPGERLVFARGAREAGVGGAGEARVALAGGAAGGGRGVQRAR